MLEIRSDSQLAQQTIRELKWDSRIDWTNINVEVRNGVATLTGSVPTYLQKLEAQNAAHRVMGILDVANDIKVKPADRFARTDTQIANAVRSALEWDALVPNEMIQSTVSDGWVTLDGEVDYGRERSDAEQAIRRLTGVVGVTNRITIRKRPVDSRELREQIELALERRADRETQRLRVEVNDGAVDLFGRVHSWQEKRAVLGSISHARGVIQVRDHLRIDPYF
jgi:osmotically-inducible protein OsmY